MITIAKLLSLSLQILLDENVIHKNAIPKWEFDNDITYPTKKHKEIFLLFWLIINKQTSGHLKAELLLSWQYVMYTFDSLHKNFILNFIFV